MKKHDYLVQVFKNGGKKTSLERFTEKHVKVPRETRTAIIGSKQYEGSTDRRALYDNALGIDIQAGEGVDLVADICDRKTIPTDQWFKYDHVDCLSVLEHVKNPFKAAENIVQLMNADATLFLSVPFSWRQHGYPSDYWRFTVEAVMELFPRIEWDQLYYMTRGVKVDRIPSLDTKFGTFYAKTEVYGFGRLKP